MSLVNVAAVATDLSIACLASRRFNRTDRCRFRAVCELFWRGSWLWQSEWKHLVLLVRLSSPGPLASVRRRLVPNPVSLSYRLRIVHQTRTLARRGMHSVCPSSRRVGAVVETCRVSTRRHAAYCSLGVSTYSLSHSHLFVFLSSGMGPTADLRPYIKL